MSITNTGYNFIIEIGCENGKFILKTSKSDVPIIKFDPSVYNVPNFCTEEEIIASIIDGRFKSIPITITPDAEALLARIVISNKLHEKIK